MTPVQIVRKHRVAFSKALNATTYEFESILSAEDAHYELLQLR